MKAASAPQTSIVTEGRIGSGALLAYGALGLPLAFAALPIYVHVPKLYGDALGLSLTAVGAVLLAVRLLDALLDPLMGWWSDRLGRRRALIAASLPFLALGMLGLFNPPAAWIGPTWLALTLTLVYLGFSLASVNYYAWGAELSPARHERTRIVASREGFALVGVVTAAVVPGHLGSDLAGGLAHMALVFLPILALAAIVTLVAAPGRTTQRPDREGFGAALRLTWENRRFRSLLAVFAANGIAAAIPATLVLFYIADVLRLESSSGLFLGLYFAAGVVALPCWVWLSGRIGKSNAWLASMGLAVAVFGWAYTLGPGDLVAFALICALSGAALGADLTLPPSLLADVIDSDVRAGDAARSGAYFGVWNFVTKLNLALAAGVSLPLLSALGYQPGATDADGAASLSLVYALLPVALKLVAAALIWNGRSARGWKGGGR
jgi:Na+/melibiose symporter-like transporter